MFYVLVSGKRDFTDYERFSKIMDISLNRVEDKVVIVEGGAKGTDSLAKRYAADRGYPLEEFTALWKENGRAAGPIRNTEMVNFVRMHTCKGVFFWDGKSRGTGDCLKKAEKAGIICEVYSTEGE